MSSQKEKKIRIKKELDRSPLSFKHLVVAAIALIVVIFFTYSVALNNKFTNWDDGFYITSNDSIKSFSAANAKVIFSKLVTDVYVPFTLLSFAAEYHFFKLQPFYYILDNILLHIAVTLLIFFFACRIGLSERAAFLGALVFGIHPMHVESVAWITERKDVLYAFFYLIAVHQYWSYLQNKKIGSYLWTVLWGVFSMLSKPMALSLPFVFLVCDWLYERKITKNVLLEKAIHFIYIAPLALMTLHAHYARAPMKSFMEAALLWLWSFTFYLQKFFFPATLLPIYNVPKPIDFNQAEYDVAILVFWLFVYMMIRHRQNKWVRFAFFYYFASIFFIIRMRVETHVSTVADRFMYLPSLGLCLLIGYFIDQKLKDYSAKIRWKYVLTAVLTVVLFSLLALKTNIQCGLWKNSESIWNLVIKTAPNSTAYNNRGQVYLDSKLYDLAIKDFNKAVEFLPRHSQAHYNKGIAYQEQKKYDLALASYDAAIKYKPEYSQAYHNKSHVYLKMKKYDLAIESCNKGLALNPNATGMYSNRARGYLNLGKYKAAMQDALKAKKLGLKNADSLIKDINAAERSKNTNKK